MKRVVKKVFKTIMLIGLIILWVLLGLDLAVDTLMVKTNGYINYNYLDENQGNPVVQEEDGKRYVYVKGNKLEIDDNYIEVPMTKKVGYFEGSLVIPINTKIIFVRLFPFVLVSIIILLLISISRLRALVLIPTFTAYIAFLMYVITNIEEGYCGSNAIPLGWIAIVLIGLIGLSRYLRG